LQLLLLLLVRLWVVGVLFPCCLAFLIKVLLTGAQPAGFIQDLTHLVHTYKQRQQQQQQQ
jgi:hypothetical protein